MQSIHAEKAIEIDRKENTMKPIPESVLTSAKITFKGRKEVIQTRAFKTAPRLGHPSFETDSLRNTR